MKKIAEFIVKKYWIFFIIFAALAAYCVFGISKVKVEYDISKYLPDDTDTAQAISIMNEEFETFGSATFVVKNITKESAADLAERLRGIDGIVNFTFDPASPSSFKDDNALFTMFFDGGAKDDRAVSAYEQALSLLNESGYRYTVPTPLVNNYAQTLVDEMVIIIAIAAAVILAVLLFTSKSFAEVIAFPFVFVVAALLNMGTNYWLGTISFVSNTVCIILQLALAIDYAIILCHRFTEEKDKNPSDPTGALTNALAKAIPEIASSSLTTVSGLVALMFMQLGLGFDLGMVLAKSILCSLLTVFLFMPGLLRLLSKPMDKTRHRNFIPDVSPIGKGVIKSRYVMMAIFAVLFGLGAGFSQTVTFCYSQNSIDTSRPTATMSAKAEAEEMFGASNAFVILVPQSVDFETQRIIMDKVAAEPLVTSTLGWAGIELPSRGDPDKKYYLTDGITSSELDDITGIGSLAAQIVFGMYASSAGDAPSDLTKYTVRLDKLIVFAFENPFIMNIAGSALAGYRDVLAFGKSQLVGDEHYRMVFNINSSVEARETFALIERLIPAVKSVCPSAVFAGESMSAYDLNKSFSHDNILITLLTVAFIFIILAVTFRSWGIPIVLVLVIQGAIFMNFSLPVMLGKNIFFFVYLIASAIQMGATIDYAILMTSRFRQFKSTMPKREAIICAISAAFPTIVTSGMIMTVAAFLVGFLTSDPLISSMGITLGTGTLISVACVLTALPALLYVLDPLLEKTVLKRKRRAKDICMPNPSRPPREMR